MWGRVWVWMLGLRRGACEKVRTGRDNRRSLPAAMMISDWLFASRLRQKADIWVLQSRRVHTKPSSSSLSCDCNYQLHQIKVWRQTAPESGSYFQCIPVSLLAYKWCKHWNVTWDLRIGKEMCLPHLSRKCRHSHSGQSDLPSAKQPRNKSSKNNTVTNVSQNGFPTIQILIWMEFDRWNKLFLLFLQWQQFIACWLPAA